jgi:hypothetical protein
LTLLGAHRQADAVFAVVDFEDAYGDFFGQPARRLRLFRHGYLTTQKYALTRRD